MRFYDLMTFVSRSTDLMIPDTPEPNTLSSVFDNFIYFIISWQEDPALYRAGMNRPSY